MLPSSQPRLLQIFSARYLEFVPENTLKGDVALIVKIDNIALFSAKVRHFFKPDKRFRQNFSE
ncbi:hypothetical protein BACPLE_03436 [Phocaeicola plebeius DSM 17135]|jgi:hypothetical protein|uniref:Uncharacterized protein n=1 Tax=Phocaeicola plebeius (strain DSM 17135 / JCM 12973 / CCUG 54634 / M2) TaxID=484018 RepID=B5D343_PHOPM|nr:hypothetical protein BACPLE_03436 [Phocaeicola plebeius DSM 17135]